MEKTLLIVEKGKDGKLWGRVEFEGDLLTDFGDDINDIARKLKILVYDFYEKEIEFEISYDLTAFFEEFSELKISKIGELANINTSLIRQYANGIKTASTKQVEKIESAVHLLGKRLLETTLC